MGARNHGLGSRDMYMAGHFAMKEMYLSHSSIATNSRRWKRICKWLKKEGFKVMEHVTKEDVIRYGEYLCELIESGDMNPCTAQNYISVANRVFEFARRDRRLWVSPTGDCGIPEKSGIAKENKAMPVSIHIAAKEHVSERLFSLMSLQREVGLRFEESAKIDAARALKSALSKGVIIIDKGTKGGRKRAITTINAEQIEALRTASEIQKKDRSMIPKNQSYAVFQRACYKGSTKAGIRFHAERHAYAQNRYFQIVKAPCPVQAGIKHGKAHIEFLSSQLIITTEDAKRLDQNARLIIAQELGHNRMEITNGYLG